MKTTKVTSDHDARPSTKVVRPIGRRNVASILLLGTSGQIAWAVENTWFNTFVYDEITQDPTPIAWMVAVSAIMATLTTILVGILSDRTRSRWGMRKPYIVFGYIAWGIIVILWPTIAWIQAVGVAVVMVVIVDAIMTFFGSTANDAAYNAWATDIGHSSNRNRITTLNYICAFIANVVALGLAGAIIESFGYLAFFFILGGSVTTTGVISIFLLEHVRAQDAGDKARVPITKEFSSLFSTRVLRENRILFLLFLNMALTGIAGQVYMPYLLIFLEYYVGFSKTVMSIVLAAFVLVTVVLLLVIGYLSHRFNRKTALIVGTVTGGFMTVMVGICAPLLVGGDFSLTILLVVLYFIGTVPGFAATVVHGGWLQDSYPAGDIGKFQGIRMVFMVALPMVFGPVIGNAVIHAFGIPSGDGFIPTPEIFIVGGLLSLLALIPIAFIPKEKGKVNLVALPATE
nr:MFS transporter [Candidatus Sigynarchaeota archaeon]